jgi:hypothetical protein
MQRCNDALTVMQGRQKTWMPGQSPAMTAFSMYAVVMPGLVPGIHAL